MPRERAKRRAGAVLGHARGPAARRHRRRPAAPDRRRAALAPAPVRARRGLLASRVRLSARARAGCWPSAASASSAPTRAPTSDPLDALAPVRAGPALVAFTLDWEAVELVWGERRLSRPIPPTPISTASRSREPAVGDRRRATTTPRGGARRAERDAGVIRRRRRRAAWPPSATGAARRASSPSRSTPSCSAIGGRRARTGSRRSFAPGPAARGPPGHPAAGAGAPPARGATAARVDLGRGQGPSHLGLAGGRRPRLGGAAARAAPRLRARRRGELDPGRRRAGRARAPRACRRATGRSWIAAAGRRLPLPALHAPTRGRCSKPYTAASRRDPRCEAWPPTSASPRCSSPEQLSARGARPHPLLGVPAADRGRARPPRPQAVGGAGRARRRGPRADPRRRGVAARGGRRRASGSTACASRSGPPTSASSSPGSSE